MKTRIIEILSRIIYTRKTVSLEEIKSLKHLDAAVKWLIQAHQKAGDGGISKGFDLLRGVWAPSYPETTGYIVPTLINVAKKTNDEPLLRFVRQLGEYLLSKATKEGGVGHWVIKDNVRPVVFDTGQVIFGWLACWKLFGEDRFLEYSMRAGDWLVSIQSPYGGWNKNQHLNVEKVIDSRVSWSLLELYKHTNQKKYKIAAQSNLDWVLLQQRENGWFDNCSFRKGDYPITHTLAYAVEGLLESGIILEDTRYINASKLTADAFLAQQQLNGNLVSTYDQNWNARALSSCLTGNCQIANLWLKFYKITKVPVYLDAAIRAIGFVAGVQDLSSGNPNVHGAIPGSYPIYGSYERLKYPNWAAKFFIDSVLFLDRAELDGVADYFPG